MRIAGSQSGSACQVASEGNLGSILTLQKQQHSIPQHHGPPETGSCDIRQSADPVNLPK
jgi:hypothetical protein